MSLFLQFQVVEKFTDKFLSSLFPFEKVKTDNVVFRFHYKLSVWLVLLFSVSYMYVGIRNPIACASATNSKKYGVGNYLKEITDYCWVHGTYGITNLNPDRTVEIYPGVGGLTGPDDSVRYYNYYKWMYFYITIMFIVLHVPRYVWRCIENGQMASLVKESKGMLILDKTEEIEKEKEFMVNHIFSYFGYQRQYAFGFLFAECLNVFVSFFLMYMWDVISDHEFSQHGSASLSFLSRSHLQHKRTDRLAKVFPIISKCTFNRYGPGGNIVPYDLVCLLPLNVVNEVAAVTFWYYFMALGVIGLLAISFRVSLIFSKRLRAYMLSSMTLLTSNEVILGLSERCSYSDWFVIYQLGLSVEPVIYREVLQNLMAKLRPELETVA